MLFKIVFVVERGGKPALEYWCKTLAEANYLASLEPYNTYVVDNDEGPFDVLK